MKFKNSIQSRISRVFLLFTLFLSLFYSFLLLGYSWIIEDNIFNRLVNNEAAFIEQQYQKNPQLILPRLPFMTLYERWNDLPKYIYQQHIDDPNKIEFQLKHGGSLHIKELHIAHKTTLLVADVSVYEVSRDYLPKISFGLIFIVILISLIAIYISWLIAKFSINPLAMLTDKVKKSNAEDIDSSFSKDFSDNEIGYLARTFEKSILLNQKILKRERNFTRDVSHELRTPTTILKNLVHQVGKNSTLSSKSISQLKGAVIQQEMTVSALLALAREESSNLSKFSLITLIEECVINHYELNKKESFDLDIKVPKDFHVLANKNLLTILINNLLSNAVNYSPQNQLKIYIKNDQIVFENNISNNPLLVQGDSLFTINVKSSNSVGLGLGLNLVKRICHSFNWHVESKSDENIFSIIIST